MVPIQSFEFHVYDLSYIYLVRSSLHKFNYLYYYFYALAFCITIIPVPPISKNNVNDWLYINVYLMMLYMQVFSVFGYQRQTNWWYGSEVGPVFLLASRVAQLVKQLIFHYLRISKISINQIINYKNRREYCICKNY